MSPRWSPRDRWIGWGGFVLLMVLHLDSWRPQRAILYWGWVPEEILYRLGWILLVWIYLFFLTSRPSSFGAGLDSDGQEDAGVGEEGPAGESRA